MSYNEFEKFKTTTQNLFEKYLSIKTYLNYVHEKSASLTLKKKSTCLSSNLKERKIEDESLCESKYSSYNKEKDNVSVLLSTNPSNALNLKESFIDSVYFDKNDKEQSRSLDEEKLEYNNLKYSKTDIEKNKQEIELENLNIDEETYCTICEVRKPNLVLSCLVSLFLY